MSAKRGRPLTGRVVQAANGEWAASVPQSIGAHKRLTLRFPSQEEADAWAALAVLALKTGQPLPGREAIAAAPAGTARPGVPTVRMTPSQVAADWVTERYDLAQRGDVPRQRDVQGKVRRHVLPFLEEAFASPAGLTRSTYRAYLSDLIDGKTDDPARRGPKLDGPRSEDAFADIRRVLDAVLEHGIQLGAWSLPFASEHVPTPLRQRPEPLMADPLSLADVAAIAGHLHVIHQAVLWTLRILSVRLGEAYGPRVRDLIALDDGTGRGLIRLDSQGGRPIEQRNALGQIVSGTRSTRMKNLPSRRVLPVPEPLMTLYLRIIAIFHTDPVTGEVNFDARLIPGLMKADEGGQVALRNAFRVAAGLAGVVRVAQSIFEDVVIGLPRPKDMRSSAVTDMAWSDLPELVHKRWAGHEAGRDPHFRNYVSDDPTLGRMMQAAQYWEQQIVEQVPGGLCVPTERRCTTGNQPVLAADAGRIDAMLADCGWLVPAGRSVGSDDPWLTVAQAAELAGFSLPTMGRWLREGRIPAWLGPSHGGTHGGHRVLTSDLVAMLNALARQVTLGDLAEELDVPYSRLYSWVQRLDLPTEPDGARGIVVPSDSESTLRAMVAQDARLRTTGLTRREAAAALGVGVDTIVGRVQLGILEELPERACDGTAFITRASVAYAMKHPKLLTIRKRRVPRKVSP